MISLNAEHILNNIDDDNLKHKINLNVFQEIDSTNSFLKKIDASNNLSICCAEQQTKGRGRHGRDWYSPYGENIYLSLRWDIHRKNNNIEQLSIIAGLSIIEVLKEIGISKDITIKWPNDIYYQNKKLAGILIEAVHGLNNFLTIIVGVGININSNFENSQNLENNWASLLNISKRSFDRNIIIAKLISNIQTKFMLLLNKGFEIFADTWRDYDYLYNKNITITNVTSSIDGISKGINLCGELQLLTSNNQTISLKSGEVTLSGLTNKL